MHRWGVAVQLGEGLVLGSCHGESGARHQDACARRLRHGRDRNPDRGCPGHHPWLARGRRDRRGGRDPGVLRNVEGHPAGDAGHAGAQRHGGAGRARGRRLADRAARGVLAPLMRAAMWFIRPARNTVFAIAGLAAVAALVGRAGLGHGQPAATQMPVPGTPAPTKVQYSDHAMGTNVTVWMWTGDERAAAQAAEAVFAEMKRLDKKMTTWDPDSEVSQVNTSAGVKPVKVSEETYAVIDRAVDIS